MVRLKVVSFNIRYVYNDSLDKCNDFVHRAAMILDKIEAEAPDIIGFQEAAPQIKAFLTKYLKGYSIYGMHKNDNSGVAIAVNNNTMELLGLEGFWLSPTPYVKNSRHENQSHCARSCVTALVKHNDIETPIRVYDVHLDHWPQCEDTRVLEIKQVLERMVEDRKKFVCPAVLMGDFNSRPDAAASQFCANYEQIKLVDVTKHLSGSYHGFKNPTDKDFMSKIDYIYWDEETAKKIENVHYWTDEKDGIFLSDHYPVSCEFDLE